MVSVLLCPAYVPGCAPLNTEFFSLAVIIASVLIHSFFFFLYGSLPMFEKGGSREQNTLASFTPCFITGYGLLTRKKQGTNLFFFFFL